MRRASAGPLVHVSDDDESELGILVQDLPFRRPVVTQVGGDELRIGAGLAHVSADRIATRRTGIRLQGRAAVGDEVIQLVTFRLKDETYGINVMQVQEVLRITEIAPVPGAPGFVLGIINLRGNVVTVIDTRTRFGLPTAEVDDASSADVAVKSSGDTPSRPLHAVVMRQIAATTLNAPTVPDYDRSICTGWSARPAPKLIVDPPTFMPLRTNDMQPT